MKKRTAGEAMKQAERLQAIVPKVTEVLTDLCQDPGELLSALIHVSAVALWYVVEGKDEETVKQYVVSFCMQITKLIDANIEHRRSTTMKNKPKNLFQHPLAGYKGPLRIGPTGKPQKGYSGFVRPPFPPEVAQKFAELGKR